MGFMVERSANGATENKLYTQSYEIFGVSEEQQYQPRSQGHFPSPNSTPN